jgi:biopolymer transport protein ExbB
MAGTRGSGSLTMRRRRFVWFRPSEERPRALALLKNPRANGVSDEMYRDLQPSPGRGAAAAPLLRSTLGGLVLLLSIGTGSRALAQDAPRSEVPPAVQTAPGSSAAPTVPGAVDNKPASPVTPSGDPSGSTGSTAQTIGSLPSDLSPWSMFLNADIVVKIVMIGLALASVVTWTVWLAKGLEFVWAKRRARAATHKLRHAKSLADGARGVQSGWTRNGPVAILVDEAINETRLSEGLSADGVKERLAIELSRIEARAGRGMTRGTHLLATIGATAPFVGLFGTVWGIMNAFIGISKSHTTNLAVVAPGIAEALLATAIGLVAAVPAVIIYNLFARSIAGYRAVLSDASGAILRHVSRDLERQQSQAESSNVPPAKAERAFLSSATLRPAE